MSCSPDYAKARELFNTSASQLAHDLGEHLELHRKVEMSNAKLMELVMVKIYRDMKEPRNAS